MFSMCMQRQVRFTHAASHMDAAPPPKVPAEHSIHTEVYAHLVKLWEFKAGTAFQSLPEYTK